MFDRVLFAEIAFERSEEIFDENELTVGYYILVQRVKIFYRHSCGKILLAGNSNCDVRRPSDVMRALQGRPLDVRSIR